MTVMTRWVRAALAALMATTGTAAVVATGTLPTVHAAPPPATAVAAAPVPGVLPTGFTETPALTGLVNPTVVRFAADGRVFVAEKRGTIQVFDNLADTTPTQFADLRTNVHNFWDRGLLGLALAPTFPTDPSVYVLYSYDHALGSTSPAPRWGIAGADSDPCPTPPGPTDSGCVISGRLSKLTAAGNTMTGTEKVIIEDWCQQMPSHSVGSLEFGPDGSLYASAGEGAGFTSVDYGQKGQPNNPCADPPANAPGGTMAPPTAEGGALRSQDIRTGTDPTGLSGTVIRINPTTGEGVPTNQFASSASLNERRIIAYGLRNPYRMTVRPGTQEAWLGDVGWNDTEEVNRVMPAGSTGGNNFGWPCYEGWSKQAGFDAANLNLCESLYAQGSTYSRGPYFSYKHTAQVVTGESCPTGGSSVSGIEFISGGPFPAEYQNALVVADYSRGCIWVMKAGANGLPDTTQRQTLVAGAAAPVNIERGPDGNLYYCDYDNGRIMRISYSTGNQAPTAAITASATSGAAPLTVQLNGGSSSDPEGQALSYSWDLNGDGTFGDATGVSVTHTFPAGTWTVRLRVTDAGGAMATATQTISSGNTPPSVTITAPTTAVKWWVGSTVQFSGSATDAQDGALAASRLTWRLDMHHCPDNSCHVHTIQDFTGVASGSFVAPDHDYPSYLTLTLTATDSGGLSSSTSVRIDPKVFLLKLDTVPSGLQLSLNGTVATTPFSRQVIAGSANTVSAPTPQTLAGVSYRFSYWNDQQPVTHTFTMPHYDRSLYAKFKTP